MIKAIYETENQKIYYSDFLHVLKNAGINKGDVVFVHSDISVFGKLCILDRALLLENLINILKESVGDEGTLIMPTFSYSFCRNEIFDVQNTKSSVGVLGEFFRKQPDIARTIHPIFSVALWGRYKNRLLNISHDSFDKDSIFGKLHRIKGKILFLGAPFRSCTYIHYIEQAHGAPYRYIKTFKGKIKNGDREYEDEYTYLVRYLDRNVILDTRKLESYLLEKKMMKEAMLGNGRILAIGAEILFKEGRGLLDKNIYFFLKEIPK